MKFNQILIVEDDPFLFKVMQKWLESSYKVFMAETAEAGLEIMRQNTIHLVYTDLELPGMNGVDLIKEIKSRHPIAVVCAMTAHSRLFKLLECRELGFADYFVKPLNQAVFMRSVEHQLSAINRWFAQAWTP